MSRAKPSITVWPDGEERGEGGRGKGRGSGE